MKEFTTITELEILKAAYFHFLSEWCFEDDRLKKFPGNDLFKARTTKAKARLSEIESRLLELEQAEQH